MRGVRQNRRAEFPAHALDIKRVVLTRRHRSRDDQHFFPVERNRVAFARREKIAHRRLRNHAKFLHVKISGNFPRESFFPNRRRERVAKLHIHMHGRALRHALANGFQRRCARLSERNLRQRGNAVFFPNREMRKNPDLRNRLPRVAILKFRRAVRRHDNQRRARHSRFDNGRQIIRRRRARRAHQRHRTHRAFRQPERKKRRRALIQHGNGFQTTNFRRSRRQRRGPRTRRNNDRANAAIFQRLHKNRAPKRIRVSEIHRTPILLPSKFFLKKQSFKTPEPMREVFIGRRDSPVASTGTLKVFTRRFTPHVPRKRQECRFSHKRTFP